MDHSHFDREFDRLNPQQRQAVCHREGPALVIAGAGSGKTRVATMRVAHLIRSGACPQSIAAVTFTNKAAREMRERVHHLAGSEVLVSTFHSLGARILRESIDLLGYPQTFAIYSEEESEKTLRSCLKDRGLQFKDSELSAYKMSFSQMKNNPSLRSSFDSLTQSLFDQYQQRLKTSGALDFDDLIYLPLQLFLQFPETLQRYQQRWRYLLVDEYQDTSDSQCQFATSLVRESMNIFAVGDPDQSIYSWRGAKITNILSFQDHFPNATIIHLEQNYRSTNTILDAANALISCNESRFEKSLWSDRGRGEPIVRFVGQTERQEAEFVASTIDSLADSAVGYDRIAVLYRTNAQSRSLEDRLIEHHIPYRIWGGTPFYSRREIKDVLSFLQIACQGQDLIAFERAVKIVCRGIGEVTLAKLRQLAVDSNRPICDVAFDAAHGDGTVSKKQQESLTAFCTVVSSLRASIEQGSALDLISTAVRDSGYQEFLEKDPETVLERRENIEQLFSRAQEWDETHEGISPLLFIEELVLEGSRDQRADSGPQVTLATVHNAKGLEFPVVFIVGLEEDLFPHINAKKGPDFIEEERRLFYVGMTRAKDQLYLTASQSRFLFGGVHHMRISRFFKEIPAACISPQCSFPSIVRPRPPSPAPQPPLPPAAPFSVGQLVLHPQFGVGKIERLAETSAGTAYEVRFSHDNARRKILASSSPMKAISDR